MELHHRLVDLRKAKNLSQEELAEKLYVSRQTISNWERGKTYPDINSLLLIATFFDVSLDNLIKGDVDIMKHHVDNAKFKKWLLVLGVSWFLYSIAYPTRFLFSSNVISIILGLLLFPILYSLFQIFYIVKNQELKTFTAILNFLQNQEQYRPHWTTEFLMPICLLSIGYLIFFVGIMVSWILFW